MSSIDVSKYMHVQCTCLHMYTYIAYVTLGEVVVYWLTDYCIIALKRFLLLLLYPVVKKGTYFLETQSGEETKVGGDVEMARLSSQLDGWCLDLKRNVLVCLNTCMKSVGAVINYTLEILHVHVYQFWSY